MPLERKQGGAVLPYFLLAHILFCFAVFGSNTYTSHQMQRLKEQELLFIGRSFRQAINSYYQEQKTYPKTLEELVKDRRFIAKHHLRKLYPDPFTGKADWLLLQTEDGKIKGIASRSNRHPIRKTGFQKVERHFSQANEYRGWTFIFEPKPGRE